MQVDQVQWEQINDGFGPAGPVGEAVRRLLAARSRDDASKAAAALLDRATDGTAISEAVPEVVRCLLPVVGDGSYGPQAVVLYVLDVFTQALGAWDEARARSKSPERFDVQAGWERDVRTQLQRSKGLAAALGSGDPEVRTLAARVTAASSADLAKALADLERRFAAEQDPTACASLAEAVVLLGLKTSDDATLHSMVEWVASHASAADPAVRFRLARLLPDAAADAPPAAKAAAWFPAERI